MSRSLAALAFLPLLAGAGMPHAQGVCTDSYTVMRGDTLYSIARLCGSSVGAMTRVNRLASPAGIEVGQRLAVPGRGGSVPAFRREVKEEPAPPAPPPPPPLPPPRREASGYRIERGDTLYSLARWAGVSLHALLAVNPGIDAHKIEIGDLIRLPDGARDPGLARARERGHARPPAPPRPPRPPRPEEAAPPPPPPMPDDDDDKPDDMGDEPDVPGM